jgi:thymidylate kinase
MKLVIIEGPDGAGKTTLMHKLVEHCARKGTTIVEHHGYEATKELNDDQLFKYYLKQLASPLMEQSVTILDRCWISEVIYGQAYRNTSRISHERMRILDQIAKTVNGIFVHCSAPYDVCSKNLNARRKESWENNEKHHEVWRKYYYWSCVGSLVPMISYDFTCDCGPIERIENFYKAQYGED